MKLIPKVIPYSNFNIFQYGDAHLGTILFHELGFDQFVDMIMSPYGDLPANRNYAVDHGDGLEGITWDDKRFDLDTVDKSVSTPMKQRYAYEQKIKPFASKIIVLLNSNHFEKLKKFGNLAKEICDNLNIPYGTYTAKITYKDKKGKLLFKRKIVI